MEGSGATTGTRMWAVARLAFPALVFTYLALRVDTAALVDSLGRLGASSLLGCLAGVSGGFASGMVRWRLLMRAYDARALPAWREAARLFFTGAFYNTLPGAVGGDVYRAWCVRACFAGGITQSAGVVFVERVLGMVALLALSAASALLHPELSAAVGRYAALGLAAALALLVTMVVAQRLAQRAPAPLARLLVRLPALRQPAPFALAALVSVGTHLSIALGGHVVVSQLTPSVSLLDSLVVFSLGTLAAYFPATVAGAGARDVALVLLFERLGVARADALSVSLAILAANLVVAGAGGVVHLFSRTRPAEQGA